MFRHIVWMNIAGHCVGFPLVSDIFLEHEELNAIGEAIAQGAGHSYLYTTRDGT